MSRADTKATAGMSAESRAETLASKALGKAARRSAQIPPARAKRIAELRAELEGCRGAAQSCAAKAALPDAELARLAREEAVRHERIIRRRAEGLLRELMEVCVAPVSREGCAS